MSQNDNYIVNIKTIQATIFKQVIDALKDILMDVNLEIDETGLKIIAMDNTHVVLIHLKLEAEKFEEYFCSKKTYVGINMLKLHMLIKTIGTNDLLNLYIEKDDPNKLGIKITNNEKNVETNYKLSTIDIDVLDVTIPPVDFTTTITMPSSYLQKIIRDMHNISEYIEIRNVEKSLILKCKGDFCSQETRLGSEKSQNIVIQKNKEYDNLEQEIIQGVFSLKYLLIFTKCTNLCPSVEIYLKNSYPIILRYSIASLGEIKLCLAQQDI
jgi:proliferating cell nuclear antigen|uniref:Proliferating cell nuclear antigen PCNA N-terminal domain-containing protein n=1 Tax=viral metagenome TaxID=1070528 RepID=A0A6C0JRS7_9ZZZZ